MERDITLSSFSVKNESSNRPGDFTTKFTPTLNLKSDTGKYFIAFNRVISMSFTWTNINPGYDNHKIAFSKDNGANFTDIDFAKGVWDYKDIDGYIKEKTKTHDGEGKDVYPITLTFDEPTFKVIITLDNNYRLDLTKSNFNRLIGFNKVNLQDERNISTPIPNISEDTDVLNIHCDLISESLVEGKETDIIFSFGTGTLQSSYNFVLEPRRMIFNPVNKTRVSSIRIFITDGLRRPIYLNHADTAFSIILKQIPGCTRFLSLDCISLRFRRLYFLITAVSDEDYTDFLRFARYKFKMASPTKQQHSHVPRGTFGLKIMTSSRTPGGEYMKE